MIHPTHIDTAELRTRVNALSLEQKVRLLTGADFWSLYPEPAAFKANIDRMIEEIKSSRRAPGTEEIFLPGEIEYRTEEQRLTSGILVEATTVAELREVGRTCGVDIADFVSQA